MDSYINKVCFLIFLIFACINTIVRESHCISTRRRQDYDNKEILRITKGVLVKLNNFEEDDERGITDGYVDPYEAPGCPKRIFNMPWVYYGKPKKCYLVGSKGPCPPMMKMYLRNDKNHTGICDCEDADKYTVKEQRLVSKNKEFCLKEQRNLAYYHPKRRCYFLYERGPCPRGYWLILNRKQTPVCEKRRCPTNLNDPNEFRAPYWYFDPKRNRCFQAYTKGYCPEEHLLFPTKESPVPRCVNTNVRCDGIFTFSFDISESRCAPGSYLKLSKKNCTENNVRNLSYPKFLS